MVQRLSHYHYQCDMYIEVVTVFIQVWVVVSAKKIGLPTYSTFKKLEGLFEISPAGAMCLNNHAYTAKNSYSIRASTWPMTPANAAHGMNAARRCTLFLLPDTPDCKDSKVYTKVFSLI